MALSVSSPSHLQKVNTNSSSQNGRGIKAFYLFQQINLLSSDYKFSHESAINALLKMALQRVAFLPFGLLIDLYRWDLFSGKVPESQWNSHWEELREQYQKIRSPVPRTEQHFDAGAKFHIPADSQYIAYFVAHVLEFQLYRALCRDSGHYNESNPSRHYLHDCDIEGSRIAGEKLRAGLSLGLSKHWREALKEMTGDTELSADALLEYFAPLHKFLKEYNEKGGF